VRLRVPILPVRHSLAAVNHAASGGPPPNLYYSHPACLEHDPRAFSPGHPDTPQRLVVLEAALRERDWLGWTPREAPRLDERRLELVHDEPHVRAVRELCARGGGLIDPDTAVVPASFEAALRAAGGACEMARALLSGEAGAGFCAMRPAGHHAEAARAMGFCLFNNVAVAAATAIAELGIERVLILDWDVHAGNGTAEIFRERADVLVACIHQSPLYPGTGPLSDAGSGAGEGYTINLPVPPGSGEPLWLALVRDVVTPAALAFAPQLVLVSCGFDAHARDPLASCSLQTGSFAELARLARALAQAAGAPLGALLEGGYDAAILAECAAVTLPALAGEKGAARTDGGEGAVGAQRADGADGADGAGGPVGLEAAVLEAARAQIGRYWAL
jgi:acetoin utilization deacetylase AcuC-like enzyme